MESSFGAVLELASFQQPPIAVSSRRPSRTWLEVHDASPAPFISVTQQRRNAIGLEYRQPQSGALLAEWENLSSLIVRDLGQISADFVANSLSRVEKHYIITGRKEQVTCLFAVHRGLPKLLLDAVQPLREFFGERLLQLQANSDGDDVSLTATVQWSDSTELARAALNDFDQHWWLNNCSRAHGYLTFDYELVDGV